MADVLGLFDELIAKLQEGKLALEQEKAASYEAGKKAGYDLGYVDGKASVVLPDPQDPAKLFTQADMDKLAEVAKGEQQAADAAFFQPQIDELNAKLGAQAEELAQVKVQVEGLAAELAVAKEEKDKAQAEFEALKADFDAKVLAGSEERVLKVKEIAKEALAKMVVADQPLADEAVAQIEGV